MSAALHALSPCSVHYLQALEAPFELTSGACIPDLHAVNSKKTRVLSRGTFATGATTGVGWIIVNPWCNESDGILGYKTSSGNTGTAATTFASGAGTAGNLFTGAKFPYSSGDISLGVEHRVVGVGLRVRYTGIELYKGGRAVMMRQPDNLTMLGKESVDSLFSYQQAKTFPVSTEWTQVVFKPVKPDEYEYSGSPSTAQGQTTTYTLAFGVTGTAGPTDSSAIFEYEIISHLEYVGKIDGLTLSHTDLIGMSHVRNATMKDKPTRHSHKRLMSTITDIGSSILQTASPMVLESIKSGESHGFISTLMRQGRNALKYIGNIPQQIERGAMSTLRRTFSGGLLESLAPALELLAL
jgi:hypothetical protein